MDLLALQVGHGVGVGVGGGFTGSAGRTGNMGWGTCMRVDGIAGWFMSRSDTKINPKFWHILS